MNPGTGVPSQVFHSPESVSVSVALLSLLPEFFLRSTTLILGPAMLSKKQIATLQRQGSFTRLGVSHNN